MTLTTERLALRPFQADDAPALLEMQLALEQTREAAYDHPWPLDLAGMEEQVRAMAANPGYWAICLADGSLIGLMRLVPKDWLWPPAFDMGYALHPGHWGHGYATEAGEATLEYAFIEGRAWLVTAGSAAANTASLRVLKKLGFRRVGTTPMAFRRDEQGHPIVFEGHRFRLWRSSWKQRRQANR